VKFDSSALLLVLLVLTGASPALAGEPLVWSDRGANYTLRDQQGRTTEHLTQGPSGTYIRRDARGARLGTDEPTPYGDYVLRNNRGERTGTLERRRY
jgi:hypothetical protein